MIFFLWKSCFVLFWNKLIYMLLLYDPANNKTKKERLTDFATRQTESWKKQPRRDAEENEWWQTDHVEVWHYQKMFFDLIVCHCLCSSPQWLAGWETTASRWALTPCRCLAVTSSIWTCPLPLFTHLLSMYLSLSRSLFLPVSLPHCHSVNGLVTCYLSESIQLVLTIVSVCVCALTEILQFEGPIWTVIDLVSWILEWFSA